MVTAVFAGYPVIASTGVTVEAIKSICLIASAFVARFRWADARSGRHACSFICLTAAAMHTRVHCTAEQRPPKHAPAFYATGQGLAGFIASRTLIRAPLHPVCPLHCIHAQGTDQLM